MMEMICEVASHSSLTGVSGRTLSADTTEPSFMGLVNWTANGASRARPVCERWASAAGANGI